MEMALLGQKLLLLEVLEPGTTLQQQELHGETLMPSPG